MAKYDFSSATNPFSDAVNPFDDEDKFAGAVNPFQGAVNPFDDDAPTASNEGSLGKDLVASWGVGSNMLLSTLGSAYGLATGDMDNWAKRQGESGQEFFREMKSAELAKAEIDRSEAVAQSDTELGKFGTAIWETVKNPRLLGNFIVEQAPMTLATGGAGRGVALGVAAKGGSTAAATAAGTATAIGGEGVLQGSSVGEQVYADILNMPEEIWQKNGEYRALSTELSPDEAKRQLALNYARQGAVAAGVVSAATQKLPGGDLLEKTLAGGGRAGMAGGRLARTAKGIAGEGLQEVAQEGSGQVIGNIGKSQIDYDQNLLEGAGEASGLGLLGGGVMGGVVGAMTPAQKQAAVETAKQEARNRGADELEAEIAGANAALDLETVDIDSYINDELIQADRDTRGDIGPVELPNAEMYNAAEEVSFTTDRPPLPEVDEISDYIEPTVPADPIPAAEVADFQPEEITPTIPEPIQPNTNLSAEPVTIWTGRKGDGYDTIEDAQKAILSRVKTNPDLQWQAEQMPSGKYRLAGYQQGESNDVQRISDSMPEAQIAEQTAGARTDAFISDRDGNGRGIVDAGSPAVRGADVMPDAERAVDPQPALDLPEILATPRKQYINRMVKEAGVKKDSPGYASALADIEARYEQEADQALGNVSFEQYQALNPDQPESVNRQAHEQLIKEYGDTNTQADTELAPPIVKADGTPFKSERMALSSAKQKGFTNPVAVKVGEGWGYTETANVPDGRAGRDTDLPVEQTDLEAGRQGVVGLDDGVQADTGRAGEASTSGLDDATGGTGAADGGAALERARAGAVSKFDADPQSLIYRESEQNNLDAVRSDFPEGEGYNPIVTVLTKQGSEILDGHNRTTVAKERGESIPAIELTGSQYEALKGQGYDDTEITYAALTEAGEYDAASAVNNQFPGAGVASRGDSAAEMLADLPPSEGGAQTTTEGAQQAPLSTSGSKQVGEITENLSTSIRRQAAPIILEDGDTNFGRQHIEERRGDILRENGYTVDEFVEEVATGFNQIYRAGGGQLVLAKVNGKDKIAFVKLSPSENGDYYRVNSALIVEKRHIKKHVKDNNYEMLWDGVEPPSETSSESPAFAHLSESKLEQKEPNVLGHSNDNNAPDAPTSQPTLSKSGKPFRGKGTAILAAKKAGIANPQAVEVDGGWGYVSESKPNQGNIPSENNELDKAAPETAGANQESLDQDGLGPDSTDQDELSPGGAPIEAYGDESLDLRRRQDMGSSLNKELTDEDIGAQPLSKIWPKQEVDAIEDTDAAAFATAVRDSIPAKPRKSSRRARWVEEVKAAREVMSHYQNSPEKVLELAKGNRALKGMLDRVEILRSLDRGEWGRVGSVRTYPNAHTYNESGEKVPAAIVNVEIDGRNLTVRDAKTAADAIESVKDKLASSDPKPNSGMKFSVRGRPGRYFIHKENDSERRPLATFDTTEAAFDYRKNNYDDLVKAWDKVKERDNVKRTDVRSKENRPRTGADYRQGRDVSPQEFVEQFGLRHVDFGKWVKDGDGERQRLLNQAYDALMDLSNIVDIPPRAIGLEGNLIFTFGKRGSGSASAHFEGGTNKVINLTKTKGSGSLGHEWFHALDNYFQEKRGPYGVGREDAYITYAPENFYRDKKTGQRIPEREFEIMAEGGVSDRGRRFVMSRFDRDNWELVEGVRPEVALKFAELVETLDKSPMKRRASVIDKGRSDGYWSRVLERAARSFENYLIAKMEEEGYSNDFLANVVSPDRFARNPERYPYLLPEEMGPVSDAFDSLFETVESDPNSGMLYSRESTLAADAKPNGVSKGAARVTVQRFMKKYKGADDVKVEIFDTYEAAHGEKAPFRTKAGYDPDANDGKGALYIYTGSLDSVADLQETLQHELLVHKGLGFVEPERLAQFLSALRNTAQNSPELKALYDEVERVEKGRPDSLKAEEILARIAQERMSFPDKVWNRIVLAAQRLMNYMFGSDVSARRQGKDLVYRIGDAFAEGKRAGPRVDADGMMSSRTRGWDGFPDAIIAHKSVSDHPDYNAAKSGDMDAAIRLAEDRVTDDYIDQLLDAVGESGAVVTPVLAIEAGGRNRIPLAVAEVIADRLGLDVETDIIQLDQAERSGKDGFYRIANQPEFGGEVREGDYIIVDDTLAQGGTIAQLKEYIEANGGRVILATALTGKQYSSKIALSSEMLGQVRDKYGELEPWFTSEFGYDFSGLTQSEARYIVKSDAAADDLRNRITAARNGSGSPESQGLFRGEESEVTPPKYKSRTDDTFTPPVEERMADKFLRNIQDKFRPLKRLQKAINDSGGTINDATDTYMAEEAFYGKTENDLKKLEKRLVEPLVKSMTDNDISQDELDLYLIANHAKERNAYIASINENMPDGGSGMTNAASDEVMAKFREEGKLDAVKAVAEHVYKITETRRRILEDAGLVDADYLAQFETPYENYVPLKGFAENETDGRAKTGRGFDVRGKEDLRAMGRRTMAESPTLHAIQDMTASAIRLRKNEVGQTFLRMVEANPNPDYWEVFDAENPDTRRTMVNGKVTEQPITNMGMLKDDYFAVKRDGKEYFIKVKDKRVQEAMQNIGPEQMNAVVRVMGRVTRFLSAVNTSYNPEFMISNMSRDIQTAMYNALAEQDVADGKVKGQKLAAKMANPKNIAKAARAIWVESRDNGNRLPVSEEYQNYYKEFLADGAKTGYFDSKDIDGLADELTQKLRMASGSVRGRTIKAMKAVGQFVEDANGSIENAVRLSAYIEARKAGVSRKKAASFAKGLTVNFNRKGQWGPTLNAAYMFANASLQGTANFMRAIGTMADSEQGKALSNAYTGKRLNNAQKAAGVMVASGLALAMLNREMAGDDDDGENWYDKVPDYVRERNIVIMKSVFGGPEGEFISIPLPYGYNIFYNLGDTIEGAINGSDKRREGLGLNLALSAINSFSPIGYHGGDNAAEAIAMTFSPTIGVPALEIGFNTNHFGSDIYRENFDFGPQKADAEMSMRSTKQLYRNIAEFMNEVSGGSTYQSGTIDISPDTLEHLAEFALGGMYRLADRSVEAIDATIDGRELAPRNIPFVRKVSGEVMPYEDISGFYDARQEILNLEAESKILRGRERIDFVRENRDRIRLKGMMDSTYDRLRDLNKRRDRIEEDEDLTDAQRDERLRVIETMKKREVDRFNKRWNAAG